MVSMRRLCRSSPDGEESERARERDGDERGRERESVTGESEREEEKKIIGGGERRLIR